MDTSKWLQGIVHEEGGSDSSPPSSGDTNITCTRRPMTEKRSLTRPQHDNQVLIKCPRCDSTHTKFCYYNNYSLTQPRYFCKTCRRYWTKGGSLRNIPVGGGLRKNKRSSIAAKKPTHHDHDHDHQLIQQPNMISLPDQLQLTQHLTTLMGNSGPIDFINETSKFDTELGNSRIHDFMGNSTDPLGLVDVSHGLTPSDMYEIFSSSGMVSIDVNSNRAFMEAYQRLMMLPFEGNGDLNNAIEMKPSQQLFSHDWQDHQGYSEDGKDSFGHVLNGVGSWNGMMNGYGSSATNPLV